MQLFLFAALSGVAQFCSCGQQDIGRRVERCFAAVLDDTDDEADADDLHRDIGRETEQTAGERDEQQRTAGNTGSAGCTDGCQEDQQDRRRKVDRDTFRIARSQRHDSDGDSSTGHVDGRTKRDRDRVCILVQPEVFTQLEVDRDIGSRTSGEES